jgi:mRNA interferase MazF
VKGKIVLVPFPFTDLSAAKLRPALILHESRYDLVVAFISSRVVDTSDPFSISISSEDPQFKITGLKCSSVIRLDKLATIDRNLVVGELGDLPESLRKQVSERLMTMLTI